MFKNEKDFQQKINGLPQSPKMPLCLRNDIIKLKIERKLKVKILNGHSKQREDAAIQAKSAGSPRAKASRFTKKSFLSSFQPFNKNNRITLKSLSAWVCHFIKQGENTSIMSFTHPTPKALAMTKKSLFSTLQPFNPQKAFTLAEVLITLVIIGVVAAITVPMLMNDTNDKQWNVARQKAKATIGEAFRLATINGEISANDTAETFVKNILPKYLKITKNCDSATECGFSSEIKRPDGTKTTMPLKWSEMTNPTVLNIPGTQERGCNEWGNCWGASQSYNDKYPGHDDSAFFQTLDGFSVNLFYNPYCATKESERPHVLYIDSTSGNQLAEALSLDVTCFNAVYDMNGAKGPNQAGKDIGFVGSFYNSYEAQAEAVLPYKETKLVSDLGAIDGNYWLSASQYCNSLYNNDWILPNVNEMSLIYLNNQLTMATDSDVWYWTRTPSSVYNAYSDVRIGPGGGLRSIHLVTQSTMHILCVRNNALK